MAKRTALGRDPGLAFCCLRLEVGHMDNRKARTQGTCREDFISGKERKQRRRHWVMQFPPRVSQQIRNLHLCSRCSAAAEPEALSSAETGPMELF